MDEYNEIIAEENKKKLLRAIKPDKELNRLPKLLGAPKRVLLVVPPGTLEESYGRLSAAAGELPMLGLAYIASSLRDQGHEVKIIDYEVNDWPLQKVEADLADFNPHVVGMTAYITNMKRCVAVTKICKKFDENIVTVLGGPQVTIFPEEAFHADSVDLIVFSEGEIIIRNVMNALGDDTKLANVRGIWFRDKKGNIVKNEREGLVDDLDIFPRPALDLYEMDKYYPPIHIQGNRVAHLLTSRGCPFKCTFCETKLTFGRSFRYHSTDEIVESIAELIDRGFDSFQFYDDIFTANKKRVYDLCEKIIEKGWKIKWMCFTRTNCVDKNLLAVMKKAGCYLITYGGESGDDELLKIIKKDLTVETNQAGISLAKEAGIQTLSSFMLGLPTETREQTMKTINFAVDSGLDYAVFPITEPYPGTEMWFDALKYGQFDHSGKYQNNLLTENSAVWIPKDRSREELEGLAHLAMRRFYLRPQYFLRLILNLSKLPMPRVFRFFKAGLSYFVFNRLKKSKSGARY